MDAGQAPGEPAPPQQDAGQRDGNAEQVLIVSPDERWLRVLDVTLRLGGFRTVSRRSIVEANRMRAGDEPPVAIVLDLGVDSSATDVDAVRGLLGEGSVPAVVILPERLGDQRPAFVSMGATVLVRPYRPSELYAALRSRPGAPGALASDGTADQPVTPSVTSPDAPQS